MLAIVPAGNAACTSGAKQVFSQFGDANYYSLLANGGFESGSTSWTTAGRAAVVGGNETFSLAGGGSHSLSLPVGASATSARFCIASDTPLARFVMRVPSGTNGVLRLDAIVDGRPPLSVGSVSARSANWAPSPQVKLWLTNFAFLAPTGTITIRLRVTATTGTWLVDDFFLDPFKKG
jgi:hypothetical protein